MSDRVPDEVRRLVDARRDARARRDFAAADALRDELHALGWEVEDRGNRSTPRPRLPDAPAATGYADPAALGSRLDEPPTVDASVQLVAEDHPGDLVRTLAALAAAPPDRPWELVVVANAPTEPVAPLIASAGLPVEPILLETSERLGWAESRNLGLRRSRGAVTVILDTSVEPTGDLVGPLLSAFDDPSVGLAGGWGVTSADGRSFDEAPPGEVDAVEGYCLAIRREALRTVGGFDRRFRFYRNADLDLSFAVRDAGWRAVRVELPAARHEHRGWTALPDAERDRLSRRNFYRFLDHWRGRDDLLRGPG